MFWLHCVTCGILIPQPGIKSTPYDWKSVLTTGPPGKSRYDYKCIPLWFQAVIIWLSADEYKILKQPLAGARAGVMNGF